MDVKAEAFIPKVLPTFRVNVADLSDSGPSRPETPTFKEIGVGTDEFPVRAIICLKPPLFNDDRMIRGVNNPKLLEADSVYIFWDHSTIQYNTVRSGEIQKLGSKYGSIHEIYICGLKNLKSDELSKDDWRMLCNMENTCTNMPFGLSRGGYTPYEQVITKVSEVSMDHLFNRHRHPLIIIIVSNDHRYVRYLNRCMRYDSITPGLISTSKDALENTDLIKTHLIQ